MKDNKSKVIMVISLSFVMVLCAVFSLFFKEKEHAQLASFISGREEVKTSSPDPDTKQPETSSTREKMFSLKSTCIDFLTAYYAIPTGSENSLQEKQKRLRELFTPSAAEKYIVVNSTDVNNTQRHILITTTISFSDISVYVNPNHSDTETTVFIDCKKRIKTSEMAKAVTSHFQFCGVFLYNPEINRWQCDDIISSEDIIPAIESPAAGD